MEPVPRAGWAFFPLDEQLGLLPGSLTPTQEEYLVHLSAWMPFARASELLHEMTGVFISEATARRHTQQAGQAYVQVQTEQAHTPVGASEPQPLPDAKLVLSSDGAYVPLLHGQWAEVRTLAIGKVEHTTGQVRTRQLSYFSRMVDATTFGDLAEVETRRRQVTQATEVCAVTDGAPWLQELVDPHRPDAVRILDFPHAAQRITDIVEILQQAGFALPEEALPRCLHLLKHRGPRPLLRLLNRLPISAATAEALQEPREYLRKRERLMDYPSYQQAGWPIGSGMVESANKTVMQARLKGAGMHWAPPHVNPMLALRNAICNDRWAEAWEQQSACRLRQRKQRASQKASRHQERAAARFIQASWMCLRVQRKAHPPTLPPSASVSHSSRPAATLPGSCRPSASHIWKCTPACRPKLVAKT